MLDLHLIQDNPDRIKQAIMAKSEKADVDGLLKLAEKRKNLIRQADDLKAERNRASQEIGKAKQQGRDASGAIEAMKKVSDRIKDLDRTIRETEEGMRDIQMWIPNIPHDSVPVGSVDKNKIVREWGKPGSFDFSVKPHWDIGADLDILDFDRASRLSGSNFTSLKGAGARLERALINFMIDLHVEKHGYTEVWVPFVVRREIMFGTGQLPKLEEDSYCIEKDDLFLIPTAEVPVTNLYRETILDGNRLPIKHVGYTPCFRREAGSYGADTRGLMRVHQFDKVEMVKVVTPETSFDELETLTQDAEEILQLLNLPYRVVLLASGDLGFSAAKCYDLEVYAPGIDRWLEVSSCSNMTDFQARRMDLRFRREPGAKPEYPHTLNGSGLALPRTVIAILENYQTDEGTILVPAALRKYTGMEIIK